MWQRYLALSITSVWSSASIHGLSYRFFGVYAPSWFKLPSYRDTFVPVVWQCFGQALLFKQCEWHAHAVRSWSVRHIPDMSWPMGYMRTAVTKLYFSKAEQRSRNDEEGIILDICLYQNVSSKLLQGPKYAEHSQQTEQLRNHRPIAQYLIGHFLYRKFCISLIYDGNHEENILNGKMISSAVCFKRISIGQSDFDRRKNGVSLRKVILKFFHSKWWLLWL